ncbi:MAG: L,D-transpeptidase family protein [Thermodesulfobacteriota bacterium]
MRRIDIFFLIPLMLLGFASAGTAAERPLRLASLAQPAAQAKGGLPWIRIIAGSLPARVVLVDKSRQRLEVLQYDGSLRSLASFSCATGENHGPKEASGDSRTPEGIYFITKSYVDSRITVFGKRALHLDYPNVYDREEGKNGDGIYIHGTNRNLTPYSTNGCITLDNDDLEQLASYLQQQQTPVLIVESREKLEEAGLRLPDLDGAQLSNHLLPKGIPAEQTVFESLFLLSDGHQTVAQGRYRLASAAGGSGAGAVRGYLAGGGPAEVQIVDRFPQEESLIASAGTEQQSIVAAAASPIAQYPADEAQVRAFVENWRRAWESKDIKAYIRHYADTFTNDKMDRDAWRRYKAGLNKRYARISVDISDISVEWTPTGASVLFKQRYASDKYQAYGRKLLYLSHGGKGWRIEREIWLN